MDNKKLRGYQELEHTADWELRVWAPDLAALFVEAARGMYALTGVRMGDGPETVRLLELDADDPESLLVAFLSELLFLGEQEALAFDQMALVVNDSSLRGDLRGRPVVSQDKEIKAVTYHNLRIKRGQRGLEVSLVFDV